MYDCCDLDDLKAGKVTFLPCLPSKVSLLVVQPVAFVLMKWS